MAVGEMPGDGVVSEIDLSAIGRALWTRRWWIIGPVIATALVTGIAVNLMTPKYKSEARILYEGRENAFLRPEVDKLNPSDRVTGDLEAVANQVQLVLSRELALDVIRQLKLTERPELDPALHGVSFLKAFLLSLGIGRDPLKLTPEERVLEAYNDRLSAYAVEKSRVITIEFQSEDPELAAQATNAIADDYLNLSQVVKQEQTRGASKWLEGEIEKLRQKVAEAEARAEGFRSKTNLYIGTNNTSLSNQQLGEFNSQLAAARGQKSDAETRARLIRDMLKRNEGVEASDILNSELIRRLSEQRATLRGQLAEQSSTLLEGHPRIKELKAQIADLDRQLRQEAEKLGRALENDARIASARVEALSANLDTLKKQASSNNEEDVRLRALEREAKAQRDLLESYLAKYREATARETIGSAPSADARVISRAIMSNTPFSPKKLPTILIASLAMFALSAGFIMTGEFLRVNGGSDRIADVPHVPHIPDALGVPLTALDDFVRAFRSAGGKGRMVVFGATKDIEVLPAITIGRALANGARAILVTMTPDSPFLAAILSNPSAPGLAEALQGAATIGAIIGKDKLSGLHLVSAGHGMATAAIVGSARLGMIIEALGRAYDFVILDAGVIGEAPLDRLAKFAPHAAVIAPAGSLQKAQDTQAALIAAGFGEIAVISGVVPAVGRLSAAA
jgi:succinoglycan biosynthesis transport protein ExoP